MKKRILTTAEAAVFLGVSRGEVIRLKEAGHLRRLRGFQRPFKFSDTELERYLREGLVAG